MARRLLSDLGVIDVLIGPAGLQQFLVGAAGLDLSIPQDHDAVCLPHGGDALGDDDLCGLRPGFFQGGIQVCLCLQVQSAGGIVKNQDLSGLNTARAMEMRFFCPPDRLAPLSATDVA